MRAEKRHPALIAPSLQMRQAVSEGQRVVTGLPDRVLSAFAVGMDIPQMLFTLQHEDCGHRRMTMQRTVTSVALPTNDHVQRPRLHVGAQNRVLVIHLVGEGLISFNLTPAILIGIEKPLPHAALLLWAPPTGTPAPARALCVSNSPRSS